MMGAVRASPVEDEPQEGNRLLPIFRSNKATRAARDAEASPGDKRRADVDENPRQDARRRASEQRRRIRARRQDLRHLRQGLASASGKAERRGYKQDEKRVQQEIFRLKKELKASRQRVEDAPAFFERLADTLKLVFDFLELPGWVPDEAEASNWGTYIEDMDPGIRHRLEVYFEPHNRRLYEYLGADLGW
jgi:hypothetical protein